jgi:hypothetical protein
MKFQLLTLAPLLLGGCKKSDQDIIRQSGIDTYWQEPTNEVDILWVIDNSQSMADEQAKIAGRFNQFLTSVNDADIDWHIGVISTDLDTLEQAALLRGEPAVLTVDTPQYRELFRSRVQMGIDGSDMEKGIDSAYQALTEPLISSANAGFRRDGAALMINYFSDENDCSDRGALWGSSIEEPCYEQSDQLVPVIDLIRNYRNLTQQGERLFVSAIVGPHISDGCEGAKPGTRYKSMANAFGGLQADICDQDFGEIMEGLGLQIAGMATSFILENYAVEDTIQVWVDDESVPKDEEDGWSYDTEYHIIHFHGDGVPPRGTKIRIEYEILARG